MCVAEGDVMGVSKINWYLRLCSPVFCSSIILPCGNSVTAYKIVHNELIVRFWWFVLGRTWWY